MKPHQRFAIHNPCLLACETMNPKFHWVENQVSIILSVNAGYE